MAMINFGQYDKYTSKANESQKFYPLVIQAVCSNPDQPGDFYISIAYLDLDTSTATVRLIRTKIMTPLGFFMLDEAYGLNSNRTDGSDAGKECVICLTEDKDTLAKPCKHVSLCHSCADVVLRGNRQCPICRQRIEEVVPLQF